MLDVAQHILAITDYILGKLTYNLDLDGGSVLHVLDLDGECVFSWVFSGGAPDEQDGVHLSGADVNQFWVQRTVILKPRHYWMRFSLTYRTVLFITGVLLLDLTITIDTLTVSLGLGLEWSYHISHQILQNSSSEYQENTTFYDDRISAL